MINKAILVGRITAQPELKKTQSGVSICSFSIAVQRNYKGADGNYTSDFINIVTWRNTAEFVCKFFTKGQMIGIVGSIQSRRYEDKNGNPRTAIEVVADEAQFVESKREASFSSEPQEFTPPAVAGGNDVEFEEVEDDDLPF